MTPDQFNQSAERTRLTQRRRDAARLVLVDGLGQTEAGAQLDPPLQRQAVNEAVRRIERAFREMSGAPAGWAVVTVVVPFGSEAHRQVVEIADRERDRIGDNK